jgi:hypothetical protein
MNVLSTGFRIHIGRLLSKYIFFIVQKKLRLDPDSATTWIRIQQNAWGPETLPDLMLSADLDSRKGKMVLCLESWMFSLKG